MITMLRVEKKGCETLRKALAYMQDMDEFHGVEFCINTETKELDFHMIVKSGEKELVEDEKPEEKEEKPAKKRHGGRAWSVEARREFGDHKRKLNEMAREILENEGKTWSEAQTLAAARMKNERLKNPNYKFQVSKDVIQATHRCALCGEHEVSKEGQTCELCNKDIEEFKRND